METSSGSVTLYYPAFGPVDALLGYAFFYFVVGLGTAVALDALAPVAPEMVPEPLGTWAAILLWVVLGLVVLGQTAEQVRTNPRRFESEADRAAFLTRHRPSERRYLWWASWVLVGGTVAYLFFPGFVESFARFVRFFVAAFAGAIGPRSLRLGDAVNLVGFSLGFAALTRGLDHLVVGSLRALLADWYEA